MTETNVALEGDFKVGDWLVKPHTNTVVGPEGEAHMEPKAMLVLSLLAERAGKVVTKQEILTEVWDGTFVSEEVLPNAVWEIRRVLGDDAKRPRFIQTLPKKGYRLIATVAPPNGSEPAQAEALAPSSPAASRLLGWTRERLLAAGAVILGIGVCALYALSSGPGLDRSARTPDDPYPVLVLRFENHTASDELDWLTSGVPTMLRTGLADTPGLTIVSEPSLDRALPDAETENAIDDHRQIAVRAGAEAVVLGSVFRVGEELRIDAQIEDVVEGRVVAGHSVRGSDVFALMDELTARVRESLDVGSGAEEIQPIREMTTSSLEAFRLYDEGVHARRHLRVDDAKRLLTEAVRIDPGFALAHLELQWLALWSGDTASYEAYTAATLEHENRLPPHKRFLLEADQLLDDGEADRAEALLLKVIERQPDEEDAYLKLAHLYGGERAGRGLEVLERGVRAVPDSGYLRLYYGYQLLWTGRYPEAIHQFELCSRIDPEEPNPWDSLGEAYLVAGVPERALEHYARALDIDEGFPASHLGRSWAFALLGRYAEAMSELDSLGERLPPGYRPDHVALHRAYFLSRAGRYREAEGELAEIEPEEDSPMAVVLQLFESLIALERGDLEGALAKADTGRQRLVEIDKSYDRLASILDLLSGVAAARRGDVSLAESRLESLRSRYRPHVDHENWWYHLLMGEIALARGDGRAAHTALTSGEPTGKLRFNVTQLFQNVAGGLSLRDAPARALALEGEIREAIAVYEKLLRPDIGQRWTAALEPRYHLGIARLHARQGAREEATRHYRRFLELWSEADADLPEIREAEDFLASS